MARTVTFNINNQNLTSNVVKVDRSKLYGTSKVIIYDNKTGECETSNLYQGSMILPSGSISSVMIDKEGKYRSRSELIGFNENDEKVDKVWLFLRKKLSNNNSNWAISKNSKVNPNRRIEYHKFW